jgi:hypothetical protein
MMIEDKFSNGALSFYRHSRYTLTSLPSALGKDWSKFNFAATPCAINISHVC